RRTAITAAAMPSRTSSGPTKPVAWNSVRNDRGASGGAGVCLAQTVSKPAREIMGFLRRTIAARRVQNAVQREAGSFFGRSEPGRGRAAFRACTRVNRTDDEVTAHLAAEERFVRALVRRFTSDPHLQDDVAQETWLAVMRHTAGGGPLTRGWLST